MPDTPDTSIDSQSTPPQWTPSARELDDLDLLLAGCLAPLDGFVDPGQTPVPAGAITLSLAPDGAAAAMTAGVLDLIDPEGAPLARLQVSGTYPADGDRIGLSGVVTKSARNAFGPFRALYLTPAQVHRTHPADSLLAVPVNRPIGAEDIESIDAAAAGRCVLLLPCVGTGSPLRMTAAGLVRATRAATGALQSESLVIPVAVAAHGDVGVDEWIAATVAASYADAVHRLPEDEPTDLADDVAAIVRHDRPPRDEQGVVFFFTGLSGSGKSTLARALMDHLLEQGRRTVTSLDGDVVRHHLSKGLGFSREDRETNILRIGFVAAEISRHGGVAICSPIAPFDATRAEVRRMVEAAGGGFVLIHVATPLEECERRDRKGLYAKARAGIIPDFTGISSPYEEPANALKVDTTNRDIAECLEDILTALTAEGWLMP